jgi:hypothetical protein
MVFSGSLRVLGRHERHSRDNSRFGGFNSRLGVSEFPFRAITGIGAQAIDLAHHSGRLNGGNRVKSKKFPFPREKPGILRLHTVAPTVRGNASQLLVCAFP